MGIPDYQSLMLPVLRIAAHSERRVMDVIDPLADEFGLTVEQREAVLPSGRQRVFHNRIHWAKFYLIKAGLVMSPGRGRFLATDRGRALLAADPAKIDLETLLKEPKFSDFYASSRTSVERDAVDIRRDEDVAATPDDQIDAAYQSLHTALRIDLLDRIAENSPSFFEQLIVDLLVAMGYGGTHKNAAAQLGRSGDGGVDGVINEDRLGLDRVYVQAKRYAVGNSVGRPDVQSFVGSLVGLGATKGVFVTTSTFSAHAKDFVRHLSQRVILIDGTRLADLMIEHDVGVRTNRTVQFKRLDEDFFADEN